VGEAGADGKRIVLLSLPVSIAAFMRQPEYYTAPMFVAGVMLVAIISLLMIVAICLLVRGQRDVRDDDDFPCMLLKNRHFASNRTWRSGRRMPM